MRWATIGGARMLGREADIGSLTPGKRADLVIINATDLNMGPVHDLASTIVMQTSLANIQAVMIDGVWRKRDRRVLADGLDEKKRQLAQSGRRLRHDIGLLNQATSHKENTA